MPIVFEPRKNFQTFFQNIITRVHNSNIVILSHTIRFLNLELRIGFANLLLADAFGYFSQFNVFWYIFIYTRLQILCSIVICRLLLLICCDFREFQKGLGCGPNTTVLEL